MQTPYFSLPTLPWDRFSEDERNFRVIVGGALVLFVLLTVGINSITLPEKAREEQEIMPPRIAKLVTEIRLPPPKEEPKPEPKPELKPEAKPEPKAEEKPKALPKDEPKEVPPPKPKVTEKPQAKPVVKKAPQVTVQTAEQQQTVRKTQAKQEAQAAAQVFDSLADLREQPDIPTSFTSTQQAIGASALAADGPPAATQRNLIGKMAAGGSGGVQVAKASTGGGGAGTVGGTGRLGKTSTTSIAAVASTSAKVGDPLKQNSAGTGPSGKARRTSEQIQLVFDRYKGQIYSIYRRALREDPGLEGTLLLKLQIQPNGTVTACSVVSSELSNPDLERKIVVKVKQLNFGTANVEVWSGNFPIKFFPS